MAQRVEHNRYKLRKVTFESWTYSLPDGEAAGAVKLTKGEFHEEEGHPTEDKHDTIGDEERS